MKQIAVIGFKKIECFCYWAKYKMGFELENRERKNVWINEKEQIRYIGVFDEQDLIGRHFDDYIEVDEVRLDLYIRIKPKSRTNFNKITESVESLAKWLCENYGVMMPECVPCKATINEVCEFQCEDCLIEWLKKEIKDENI
jgi:hypothetical protein